jgi:hypothetical protein
VPKKKAKLPLSKTHPKLAKEADGWDPSTLTSGSNKKMGWICKKGHEWSAMVNNRSRHGIGCPYCSGNKPISGQSDLATTHPQIAVDIIDADATKISFGSNRKFKWLCTNGHLVNVSVVYRVRHGCAKCKPPLKNVEIGVNDLNTTHPEIAKQAYGWDPKTLSAGSGKRREWICTNKHVWIAVVGKRTAKEPRNCPICSNQKVLSGFNDLLTTNPQIAELAYGWDPQTVIAGSNKKMTWKCSYGHIFKSSIRGVVFGRQCNICSNFVVLKGFNDIATTHPLIALEADGWDPSSISIGGHGKMKWKCKLGHSWTAVVKSRKLNGCPTCSNRVVLAGFNDLKSRYPKLAQEAYGWDPELVTFATTERKKWKCTEGHTWASTVKNRSQLNRGCPSCATSGFDPSEEGWLYFINHTDWQMLQIGITNHIDRRMAFHRKLGWEIIEIRGPMDGLGARKWETSILAMLRAQKADLGNIKIAGKFEGYSEAWSKSTFPVKSIKELMRLTEEFEDLNKGRLI